MARIGTPNLNLGTWEDGENPGAGPQESDSNGLNGDRIKIDTAVGTAHNSDGSHKSAVIDGVNLKSTVADGSTIEQNSSTKKLQVVGGGVDTTQLADDSVTKDKINSNVADGVTIHQNASAQLEVKDASITSSKLAGSIATEKLEYTEYVGFISQSGTNPPTLTEISNTIGAITPSYINGQNFKLTCAGFALNKTFVLPAALASGEVLTPVGYGSDYVNLWTSGTSGFSGVPILIRVYP